MAELAMGGMRLLMDVRGMLHLKHHLPDAPEMSLVLGQARAAGWMSDGRTFGDRHFLDLDPNSDATRAFELLRSFAEAVR